MGLLSKLLREDRSSSPEQLAREADEEIKQMIASAPGSRESREEEDDTSTAQES